MGATTLPLQRLAQGCRGLCHVAQIQRGHQIQQVAFHQLLGQRPVARPPIESLESPLILVTVRENEPFEKALRRFRRKVEREGIRKDIKKNSFYLKPGEKRRLKQRLAEKRRRKALRRAQKKAQQGGR